MTKARWAHSLEEGWFRLSTLHIVDRGNSSWTMRASQTADRVAAMGDPEDKTKEPPPSTGLSLQSMFANTLKGALMDQTLTPTTRRKKFASITKLLDGGEFMLTIGDDMLPWKSADDDEVFDNIERQQGSHDSEKAASLRDIMNTSRRFILDSHAGVDLDEFSFKDVPPTPVKKKKEFSKEDFPSFRSFSDIQFNPFGEIDKQESASKRSDRKSVSEAMECLNEQSKHPIVRQSGRSAPKRTTSPQRRRRRDGAEAKAIEKHLKQKLLNDHLRVKRNMIETESSNADKRRENLAIRRNEQRRQARKNVNENHADASFTRRSLEKAQDSLGEVTSSQACRRSRRITQKLWNEGQGSSSWSDSLPSPVPSRTSARTMFADERPKSSVALLMEQHLQRQSSGRPKVDRSHSHKRRQGDPTRGAERLRSLSPRRRHVDRSTRGGERSDGLRVEQNEPILLTSRLDMESTSRLSDSPKRRHRTELTSNLKQQRNQVLTEHITRSVLAEKLQSRLDGKDRSLSPAKGSSRPNRVERNHLRLEGVIKD